ncbi:MAG: TonB-dependent receptor [Desulfobacteraceae bacterium]|jgi:vitamin B12 transporter
MNKKGFTGFLAVSVLMASFIAAGFAVCEEAGVTKLQAVVVTATGTEISADKVGGNSVTVITAKDIEAMKPSSVADILKSVPGLDVAANGGPGTNTSVFLRGADSKNTLILVDGVMLNDPSSANRSAELSNLTVDNIERVEVVKGPMSVMYGSNATSGVVNIITKKGKGPLACFADFSGGSYGTVKAAAGVSGAAKSLNYALTVSGIHSDGYSVANDENDHINKDGNTSEEDAYENYTFSGRVGYDFFPGTTLDLVTRYTDSSTDLDDYGSGYAGDAFAYDINWNSVPDLSSPHKRSIDARQSLTKASLKNSFADRFVTTSLSYQLSDQKREYTENDGSDGGYYKGKSHEGAFQGDLNFDTSTVSLGVSYYKEFMESTAIDERNADIVSVRIQEQYMPDDAVTVIVGARIDDHERFGDKTTYRIAPSYAFKTGTCLKASYGTGFRAPSLYELYEPTYGNDDLGPEESSGWDFGVEQAFKDSGITLGCTYFNMVFDDRIVYDFATSQYNQLDGKTRTSGVESYVGWSPMTNLDLTLAYNYIESEDPDGARLARRPYNKYQLNARYRFIEKALVNLDIRYLDKRRDTAYATDAEGNAVDYLDAYTLVNLALSYNLTKHVELYGRIDNLFDEYYEECWSYATAGLSGYAGVKVKM